MLTLYHCPSPNPVSAIIAVNLEVCMTFAKASCLSQGAGCYHVYVSFGVTRQGTKPATYRPQSERSTGYSESVIIS